jgi:hypothetical protein
VRIMSMFGKDLAIFHVSSRRKAEWPIAIFWKKY